MKDELFEKWTKLYWLLMGVYLVIVVLLALLWGGDYSIEYAIALLGYGIISIGLWGTLLYIILSIPILLYIKFIRWNNSGRN